MKNGSFKVLNELDNNSSTSQRKLAKIANISLGKVNSLLKEFVEEDYIDKILDNNKYIYQVTDLGKLVLRQHLDAIAHTKLSINEKYETKLVREAVILAAGRQKEFNVPVATLHIGNEKIIERTIKILHNNGIDKIVLVTGYNRQCYSDIFEKYDYVHEVVSDSFDTTGTMESLKLAKEMITDDFILIESDLVFESKAIVKLLEEPIRDCIILTELSGVGDEAYIEIRNNYLYKIGKDIHQFNSIDGEAIGIVKISKRLYGLMLEEYSRNKNPMINYEYTLLDVARKYDVGYVRIDDLIWSEVDYVEQYNRVLEHILPKINQNENIKDNNIEK